MQSATAQREALKLRFDARLDLQSLEESTKPDICANAAHDRFPSAMIHGEGLVRAHSPDILYRSESPIRVSGKLKDSSACPNLHSIETLVLGVAFSFLLFVHFTALSKAQERFAQVDGSKTLHKSPTPFITSGSSWRRNAARASTCGGLPLRSCIKRLISGKPAFHSGKRRLNRPAAMSSVQV